MRLAQALPAAVAAIAGAVALRFTWQPGLASLFDDSVSYLVLAQAASPFGQPSAAVLAAAPLEKYPPLLAWIIALAGGAHDWRIAHAVVALAFAASVLLLGSLARIVTGSLVMGAGAALAYALMPGTWLNVKGILSEFPYMALSFGALALHASRGANAPSRGAAIAIGFLLAGAFLARTIAVALVGAIVLAEGLRFLRARDAAHLRAAAWMGGIALGAALLWYLARPSGGEDAYVSFGSLVASQAGQDGAKFAATLVSGNASAIADAWLTAVLVFWGDPGKPAFLAASAIGIAGLLAVLARAVRGEADGLYVVFFLAILLAWPFPGQMYRLALPVLPLLLLGFLWAWARASRRLAPAHEARMAAVGAALAVIVCAPATLFYVMPRAAIAADEPQPRKSDIAEFYRIPSLRAAEASALAQIGVLEDLRRIRETTPAGARVMWYWPNYVALLGERHGVRLERPRDLADLAAQVRAARADYIYLAELHPRDSAGRAGHPLDPLVHARELGAVVWQRASAAGTIRGVLIRIDPQAVQARPSR